ncbi:MAG: SURF1 family protein [Inquilinaceae bacterium]
MPTLIVLPMLTILIGLGIWQLERLKWKADLLDRIETQTASDAVALPADIDDPAAWAYRPVTVTGTFLHDRELYLLPRTHEGAVGVHVLTPLRRTDVGAGAVAYVLIDRGWVPMDRRDPARRPAGQVGGVVTVEGIARAPAGRAWMQPDNRPDTNEWFGIDLAAMARHAGVDGFAPVFIEADVAPQPGGVPVGGQTRIAFANNHLQYALTWFGLAAVLAVVYGVYSLKSRRLDKDRP